MRSAEMRAQAGDCALIIGSSVSAYGRAWAAGEREKRGRALRRKGRSRRAQGRKREPPTISEKRPNDSTDTY